MALRRRSTSPRPAEKAAAALSALGALLFCAVVFTGGLHGPLRKTLWVIGLVCILAAVACSVVGIRRRRASGA